MIVWNVTILSHKQLETHGCGISSVSTNALVLKHQGISIHSAEQIISVFQFHTKTFIYGKQCQKLKLDLQSMILAHIVWGKDLLPDGTKPVLTIHMILRNMSHHVFYIDIVVLWKNCWKIIFEVDSIISRDQWTNTIVSMIFSERALELTPESTSNEQASLRHLWGHPSSYWYSGWPWPWFDDLDLLVPFQSFPLHLLTFKRIFVFRYFKSGWNFIHKASNIGHNFVISTLKAVWKK